jgi:cytochrome b561
MATTNQPVQFALLSRILHWLMAAMLLTMLFIGVSMFPRWKTTTGFSRSIDRWVS